MKIKTSDELFAIIEKAKSRKPTEDELRKQRVSFIYGSVARRSTTITRAQIQKVLDENEGKVEQ